MNNRKKLRALISSIPLILLIFGFGMVQVIGIDNSFATARNFFNSLILDQFSLLHSRQTEDATFTVNGRQVITKIGTLSGNGQDILSEYNSSFKEGAKRVYHNNRGGNIIAADAETINHIAVESSSDSSKPVRCIEQVIENKLTSRKKAILEDPVIRNLVSEMKETKISPKRIKAAMDEYVRTQEMSDPVVASYMNDMLVRIDEIKRRIDVDGSDIIGIDRLPGSVRIMDASKRGGTIRMVVYENKMSLASNVSYYMDEFKTKGWASIKGFEIGSSYSEYDKVFLFEKPSAICLVAVNEGDDGYTKSYIMHVKGFSMANPENQTGY